VTHARVRTGIVQILPSGVTRIRFIDRKRDGRGCLLIMVQSDSPEEFAIKLHHMITTYNFNYSEIKEHI
jgi:hypothetical protein